MYKHALAHFREVDPILYEAAKKQSRIELEKSKDYFVSLCREIIGQQLSGNVARVIYDRFVTLFPDGNITPVAVQRLEDKSIRDVGMAWAKVRSIKDLAVKVQEKAVHLDKIDTLDNEAVVLELTQVKGIGPWTAEMFLLFALGREDVFSPGDLGLRNGIAKLYKLEEKPSQDKMLEISHKWQPYRTYASLILWSYLDNFVPPVGE